MGYTLLIGSIATMAVAPAMYEKLPYEPIESGSCVIFCGWHMNPDRDD
jgi:hypothetical protein